MEERSAVKTVGYVTGIGILLLVLFLVAGITTGFLPWRDDYAAAQPPQGDDPAVVITTPTPTPTPEPTVTPTPEVSPEVSPEPSEVPEPTPSPTPAPTPTPGVSLDEELPTYTVTVTFGRGGKAIPYGMNKVVENGSITIVAIPDEGYAVENMVMNGVSLGALESYTLEQVTDNYSFYISFTRAAFAPTPTPTPAPTPTPTPVPTPTPAPEVPADTEPTAE